MQQLKRFFPLIAGLLFTVLVVVSVLRSGGSPGTNECPPGSGLVPGRLGQEQGQLGRVPDRLGGDRGLRLLRLPVRPAPGEVARAGRRRAGRAGGFRQSAGCSSRPGSTCPSATRRRS